jgi:hypothetical protein
VIFAGVPDNGLTLRELVVRCARNARRQLEAAGHVIEAQCVSASSGGLDEWDLAPGRVVLVVETMGEAAAVEPIVAAEVFEPVRSAGCTVVRAVFGSGRHAVEDERLVTV